MISIVLACLNNQRTIIKTIESVLIQSNKNFEFIIIDGSSNDDTVRIIKSFEIAFKKANIHYIWISEKDRGIYEAWNKGITLSQGNWISFIGADDILIKDYVNIYSNFLKNNKNLEYISSIVHVVDKNRIIRIIDNPWNWKLFKRNMNIAHVGSLHSINLYKKLGLYNEQLKIAGDYELLLRAKDTLKTGFINKCTVEMGANGISNTHLFLVLKETKEIKIEHKTVSRFQSNIDLVIIYLKVLLNRIIK
jgi:glycosyltransferase involved in cell wall biosynthesis